MVSTVGVSMKQYIYYRLLDSKADWWSINNEINMYNEKTVTPAVPRTCVVLYVT